MEDTSINGTDVAFNGIEGAITSALAAYLSTRSMEGWLKQLLVIVVALAFAFVYCLATGKLKAGNVAASFLIVVVSAWGAYKTFLSALVPHLQSVGPIKDSATPAEIQTNITQGEHL